MSHLISNSQININLRRSASKGLISLINQKQLIDLALKHYGVYQDDKFIGYTCPYSGKIISDFSDIVLEHIIPISSQGGTVLFNCIPVTSEVNSVTEKGAQHLLAWWIQKDYYEPEKLDKLLSYIFDAYDIVFREYTVEEIENSYTDIDLSEYNSENKADNSTTSREQAKKIEEQAKKTGLISYLGFVNDCLSELRNKGYDITIYEEKLKQFEKNNIFKEIERYTLFQETLKKVIKSKLDNDNRSELTYVLNINVSKLMQSMKDIDSEEQIYDEILKRINNIESILKQKEINLISFFEDVKNHDILYNKIEQITETDINKFIDKINLCVADRLDNLIKWINKNKRIPSARATNTEERNAGKFFHDIRYIDKLGYKTIKLTSEQLKIIATSKNSIIYRIYEEILLQHLQKKVKLSYYEPEIYNKYVDNEGKINIKLVKSRLKKINMENRGIATDMVEQLILWIEENDKIPPVDIKIGQLYYNLKNIDKKNNSAYNLTYFELKKMANSNSDILKKLYEEILLKRIMYNIDCEYIEQEIYQRYLTENGIINIKKVKDRLETLKKENKSFSNRSVRKKEKFEELMQFMISNNRVPYYSRTQCHNQVNEYENKLRNFLSGCKTTNKATSQFGTILSKEQLKLLANSEQDFIRRIYEEILLKSIKSNISILYIDNELLIKFINNGEYDIGLIERRLYEIKQLNNGEELQTSINDKLNDLISWILEKKKYPAGSSKDEKEKQLGKFLGGLKQIDKSRNTFTTNLREDQLKLLADSSNEKIKRIYKEIYLRHLKYNAPISYTDTDLFDLYKDSTEHEIDLELNKIKDNNKKDSTITNITHEELILWIEYNQRLPKSTGEGEERKMYQVLGDMKRVTRKKISQECLKRMALSEYDFIQTLYEEILLRCIKSNVNIAYIDEDILFKVKNEEGNIDFNLVEKRLSEIKFENLSQRKKKGKAA